MNDFFNQAVVLIYPDGVVEKIPIDGVYPHSLVLKKHLGKSKRFYELCGGLNFDVGIHMHIDKVLLDNKVIVIYNYNLKEIINDYSYIYRYPPQFKVFIGTEYASSEQKREYEELFSTFGPLFVPYYYD